MRKVCVPTILTRYHDDLAIGAVSEGCTLSSLEAKVQPIQVSPCQAGLAGQRLSVSTRFLLYQHALVPFGFHRQVGWLTQKSSLPNFSFLQKGSINGLSGAHHQRNAPAVAVPRYVYSCHFVHSCHSERSEESPPRPPPPPSHATPHS